jgi:hypothetical protein
MHHLLNSTRQLTLNGAEPILALPTAEVRPFVLNEQANVAKGSFRRHLL